MVQKEYAGTESKSETEKLLRKALEDYEDNKFVAKADNLTVGELSLICSLVLYLPTSVYRLW